MMIPWIFPIGFLFPPGICSLALVQSLCEAHNAFLDIVRDREKEHIRNTYRENRRRERWNEAGGVGGNDVDADGMDIDREDAMDEEESINQILKEIDENEVSTRDVVNKVDCLVFDKVKLLEWVTDRATTFNEGGMLDFDFDKIEQ